MLIELFALIISITLYGSAEIVRGGLAQVPRGLVRRRRWDVWGGLSLTLFLFGSVVLLGMPMGLGLALMRRSEMPVVRWFAVFVIDTVRSLPLFTAAVVAPLFLSSWLEGDKI